MSKFVEVLAWGLVLILVFIGGVMYEAKTKLAVGYVQREEQQQMVEDKMRKVRQVMLTATPEE